MENQQISFTCCSCGKKVVGSSEEAPCELLEGWMTMSHWKGVGTVEHLSFCSSLCLRSWVESHVPTIPKVFLESFREDEG